jgi:hypothetical protein
LKNASDVVRLGQQFLSLIGRQRQDLGLLLRHALLSLGQGEARRLALQVVFNHQQMKCVGVGIDLKFPYMKP